MKVKKYVFIHSADSANGSILHIYAGFHIKLNSQIVLGFCPLGCKKAFQKPFTTSSSLMSLSKLCLFFNSFLTPPPPVLQSLHIAYSLFHSRVPSCHKDLKKAIGWNQKLFSTHSQSLEATRYDFRFGLLASDLEN